ncbi:MAG: lysozyme inhibitor LprI family protein [Hyphomicrobiaceae bacterium]
MRGARTAGRWTLSLALGLGFLSIAEPSAEEVDCENASSTVEMNYCGEQAYLRADAELNRVYQEILAGIDGHDDLEPDRMKAWKEALKAAQRAWVDFKEKDCGELIGYEWYGGTGAGPASYGCFTQKTETRIKELKERYEVSE